MSLVQIERRTGWINRVKPEDQPPILELDLADNQTVVSADMRESFFSPEHRRTTDWYWTAYIATRL